MKKTLASLMLIAAAAMAFSSCNKSELNPAPNGFEVIIEAGNPASDSATKTYIDGLTPYWNVGDAIGLTQDNGSGWSNSGKFTSTLSEPAQVSQFTGTISTSGTYYAYYPYTSNGGNSSGIKIDIPTEQNPKVGSFDGKADVLISLPVELTAGQDVAQVRFTRATSVVKVVVKSVSKIAGEYLQSFSMTAADKDITGRAYMQPATHDFGKVYFNESKKVTAVLGEDFVFGTTSPSVYYSIVPAELKSGDKLTFEGSTENYNIKKEVTLSNDLEFAAGSITTINLTLADSEVTVKPTGQALPIVDYGFWNTNTTTSDGSTEVSQANIGTIKDIDGLAYVSSASKTFMGPNNTIKFGTSKANGYIRTIPLNLAGAFKVSVRACAWINSSGTPDASSLYVMIDGDESSKQTYELSDEFEDIKFDFPAATSSSFVEIGTTGKRAYVTDIIISDPSFVAPAGLSVQDINDVPAAGVTDATAEIAIKEATGWTPSVTFTGCVSAASISGSTITYSVSANTQSKVATGTIVVKLSKSGNADITKTINVTQLPSGTYIVKPSDLPTSSPSAETTFTSGGVQFYSLKVYGSSGAINFPKSAGAYIANKSEISDKIKKVTIYCTGSSIYPSNLTVYAGATEKPATTTIPAFVGGSQWTTGAAPSGTTEITYDFSGGDYSYFNIVNSTNYVVAWITSIKIETK